MYRYASCLLCDEPRQGWIEGSYAYPGHDCQMCVGHCEWSEYWAHLRQRGLEDDMRRQLLVTRARARGSRGTSTRS